MLIEARVYWCCYKRWTCSWPWFVWWSCSIKEVLQAKFVKKHAWDTSTSVSKTLHVLVIVSWVR